MPTNLYGPNDNFDLETSHVLPALIRKFHEAKVDKASEVIIWGTGTPKREFLHVDDMADASVYVMNLSDVKFKKHFLDYPKPCFVNVGTGKDISIKELAEIIKNVVGFKGKLRFDTSQPDGTKKKLLDMSRMNNFGWNAQIDLIKGIEETYAWYVSSIT